jgi:hypothetical protein
LGFGSLYRAATFPGVLQQGTCDGRRRLASVIHGHRAALLSHEMALPQPPVWRPFLGFPLAFMTFSFPSGASPVACWWPAVKSYNRRRGPMDWIAFRVSALGSYMQCLRTVLYLSNSLRVLFVNCNPLLMI